MSISFRRLKSFPHFLYLLPLFFVLHGYTQNRAAVTTTDFFELMGEYSLVSGGLFLVGYLFFRQWQKAALFSFSLLFLHLFFGALHDTLKSISPTFFLAKYSILLPLLVMGLLVVCWRLKKAAPGFPTLFTYLNLLFLALVLVDVPALFSKKETARVSSSLPPCPTCEKPDVYLIIADEYADSISLSQAFRYNNNNFLQGLRNRGFHVINGSTANYNFTPFVMASLFKMDYLAGLEGSNTSLKDMNQCRGTVNENNLLNFFKSSGYEIRNFSIFNVDNQPTKAKQNYVLIGKDLIVSHTLLQRLRRDIGYHLVTTLKLQSQINSYLFYIKECNDKLMALLQEEIRVTQPAPRFIYTHLVMPHYPYYRDKNGRLRPPSFFGKGHEFDKNAYLEYLQYNNTVYLQLLDTILKHSAKPPIIIFMGDHGFREFANPTPAEKTYYFMNLNAVYLPNKNYAPFYDGISGVNQFRALLNSSFGQKLTYHKDSASFLLE